MKLIKKSLILILTRLIILELFFLRLVFWVEICKSLVKFAVPSLWCFEIVAFTQSFCLLANLFLSLQVLTQYLFVKHFLQLSICWTPSTLFSLATVLFPSEKVTPWNVVLFWNLFYIVPQHYLTLIKRFTFLTAYYFSSTVYFR